MKKHQLWDMSWKEAEEAFKHSDTVILPVGTLHGHGPTPIGIDARSVERLADEVGRRTGMVILPTVPYGENDKMRDYPGSIAIGQHTLEAFYTDICRSLRENGVRKVIFLNGHGGNREPLVRTGRAIRELGMLSAIVEWWSIGRKLFPDLWPESRGSYMAELSVAIAIWGEDVPDLRGTMHRGEWGTVRPLKELFGKHIKPLGFSDFEYAGAQVVIPIDAWYLDLDGPPAVDRNSLEALRRRGEQTIDRLAEYIAGFAKEFQTIDPAVAMGHEQERTAIGS
jgi:creatinine amidohydrolase